MSFPSSLDSFTNPLANNKLNNPSHSSIESAQNTALTALEAKVGVNNSSVTTSLDYQINNVRANQGGTGQVGYTKGDILVAQSSSVLTKLGVGSNSQVLTADSSQATGIKWAQGAGSNLSQNYNAGETLNAGDAVYVYPILRSATLNGTTQYFTAADPSALDITGNLTLECWVKIGAEPSNVSYTMMSKYDSATNQKSYQFAYEDSGGTKMLALYLSTDGSTTVVKRVNISALGTSSWHHVGVVYTAAGGTGDFYLDGVPTGSQQTGFATSTFNSSAAFNIGARNAGTADIFNGKITQVRVWNTAQSSGSIAANYLLALTVVSGLKGSWQFTETGGNLADSSGNSTTLTNTGTVLLSSADVPTLTVTTTSVYKSSASALFTSNPFIGFVSTGANINSVAAVVIAGEAAVTSVVQGGNYYLSNTAGLVSSVAGTNSRKVGIATSSVAVLITNIW